MKNPKELNYFASSISSLACYFVDGYKVEELIEGYSNYSPSEIYGTVDMMKNNIDTIISHLSNNTSGDTDLFEVNYDGDDDLITEYLTTIKTNFNTKCNSIKTSSQPQDELKNFLKSIVEFSKSFNNSLDDTELNKFRSIMKKCDLVVRETTKNSPTPSSIDSLESFDVYTTQANEAWIQAENCKMFSATGMFINPITKINELYNEKNKMTEEISKLKAQLAEKEKEISELKNKKPVNNNK